MSPNDLDGLIDEHWEYTREIMELMYKRAFKHGYKHGKEDKVVEE